jgi:hypothetical protein
MFGPRRTLCRFSTGPVLWTTESVERFQLLSDVAHLPVAGDAILRGPRPLLCSLP